MATFTNRGSRDQLREYWKCPASAVGFFNWILAGVGTLEVLAFRENTKRNMDWQGVLLNDILEKSGIEKKK
ncbi:hypothetical protein GCK72_004984 [Caenorhabditis remanei]|uniref:Uncharacterized protein n=1 Tax=Caenorhabditis remanei TaxID=31234 RepID=A0A6A5HFA9_CAERE|nr:hypothetical protein GCK72_004984 [Caenorhabditis remanei]KAF1765033.1 hypothetical protein GCK72_004984 [Caenorhabditis remanei]